MCPDGCLQITGHQDLGEEVGGLIGVQGHGGAVQPTAQHFVTVDDGRQRRPQLLTRHAVGQPNGFGLRQPARLAVFIEPMRIGQQRYRPGFCFCFGCDTGCLGSFGIYGGGEFSDAAALQHQPRAQADAAPAGGLHHRKGHDAV
jgi:hypothetical protein